MLRSIAELTDKIVVMERRIEQLATTMYPATKKLRPAGGVGGIGRVDGVGAVTSLTFVLTLEHPERFATSRAVGACVGLRPRQRQSGGRNPELHITKAGDRDLRRLLVQSAQYMLGRFGKDSDLRRAGLALAARGGKSAKKRSADPAAFTLPIAHPPRHRQRRGAVAMASRARPARCVRVRGGGPPR